MARKKAVKEETLDTTAVTESAEGESATSAAEAATAESSVVITDSPSLALVSETLDAGVAATPAAGEKPAVAGNRPPRKQKRSREEIRKRNILRAQRQREVGRRLMEESTARTGLDVKFTAHFRETYGLFERYYLSLDDLFSYALAKASIIPGMKTNELVTIWNTQIDGIGAAMKEEALKLDKLVEDMANNNASYYRPSIGEYKAAEVRITVPVSLKLLDIFKQIDPMLISLETLYWNGVLGPDEKAKAIGMVKGHLNDMTSRLMNLRGRITRFIDGADKSKPAAGDGKQGAGAHAA